VFLVLGFVGLVDLYLYLVVDDGVVGGGGTSSRGREETKLKVSK